LVIDAIHQHNKDGEDGVDLRQKKRWWLVAALACTGVVAFAGKPQQRNRNGSTPRPKPRVVITDDPELDDNNTIIRALLYSTDYKIEGLVYTSSGVHWKGDGKGTTYAGHGEWDRVPGTNCPCTSWRFAPNEHFIDTIADSYRQVYPNLKTHDADYPTPDYIKSKIKWGNVEFVGDFSKDTDGSNLIRSLLLDDQPGPLYVTAGGGESTIARALFSIHEQYVNTPQWRDIRDKVSRKLVIIPFGDQDGTYASYIEPNWSEVDEWRLQMVNFGYGVRGSLPPEDQMYVGAAWTQENISSRGPLGALYRVWGDGKQMAKGDMTDYFGLSGTTVDQLRAMGYYVWTNAQEKGSFISEGDTPTFMNLLDNGLRADEDGSFGGWGGRVRSDTPQPNQGFQAAVRPTSTAENGGLTNGTPGAAATTATSGTLSQQPVTTSQAVGRGTGVLGRGPQLSPRTAAVYAQFFVAAQNDFAARLKWSVTPKYADANHELTVTVDGPLNISAKIGSIVRLQGQTSDPDGNMVAVKWWQYNDPGTYLGDISLSSTDSLATSFQIPSDAKPGQTIHVILEATDNGRPPLTRYQRIIVTVVP
jgi:hypothetical protein